MMILAFAASDHSKSINRTFIGYVAGRKKALHADAAIDASLATRAEEVRYD